MPLNHENLQVYQRTLQFNATVAGWVTNWDTRHAICDHLPRAAASVLENIAMASAARSKMKIKSLDYAIGSTLECATCLDLAAIKQLAASPAVGTEKQELSRILRMLVGLRRSWSSAFVKEERSDYAVGSQGAGADASVGEGGQGEDDKAYDKAYDEAWEEEGERVFEQSALFHHETLDVYAVALQVARLLATSASVQKLNSTDFRRLDALLTSMVLNIAEGNGRFSEADQGRFLGTSHEAAIKLATRLDLCAVQGLIPANEVAACKQLLERVAAMTASMIAGMA